MNQEPHVFNLLQEEALHTTESAYGSVGTVYSDDETEAVWVSKQDEAIEPGWFSQPMIDLLVVLQGQLYIEFEKQEMEARILRPGEMLVLPTETRCRAYRWPRDSAEATVFLAVYPRRKQGMAGEKMT
jgi:hypothetical protein